MAGIDREIKTLEQIIKDHDFIDVKFETIYEILDRLQKQQESHQEGVGQDERSVNNGS